jgi:hypothetical protein
LLETHGEDMNVMASTAGLIYDILSIAYNIQKVNPPEVGNHSFRSRAHSWIIYYAPAA